MKISRKLYKISFNYPDIDYLSIVNMNRAKIERINDCKVSVEHILL